METPSRGSFAKVKTNQKLGDTGIKLEYALEKFPAFLKLRDGTGVVLRPVSLQDETRLHKFISVVPEEERLFIKQPMLPRALFREWFHHPDFEDSL